MTGGPPAHPRPCPADLYAAAVLTRAILGGSGHGENHAIVTTGHGTCPACIAVAAASYGVTLASTAAGDTSLMSEPVRLALLALVDETLAELRGTSN